MKGVPPYQIPGMQHQPPAQALQSHPLLVWGSLAPGTGCFHQICAKRKKSSSTSCMIHCYCPVWNRRSLSSRGNKNVSLSWTISLAQKPTFSPGTRVSCYSTEVLSLYVWGQVSKPRHRAQMPFCHKCMRTAYTRDAKWVNHLAKNLLVLYHTCPVDLVSTVWHTWASYGGLVSGAQVASPDVFWCLDL